MKSEFLGFSEEVYLGHLVEEFPTAPEIGFVEQYELASYALWALSEKIYEMQDYWVFGDPKKTQTCAFCDKDGSSGAKFKSVSHVVPEGLGNKRVVSLEECDQCNSDYSNCEGELAKMLSIERVFSGARGKGGALSMDAGKDLSIQGQGVGNPIKLIVDASKNPIDSQHEKTLKIPVENVEFRPTLAMRSILRSAWLILPESDRNSFSFLKDFATGTNVQYPFEYFSIFSPGKPKLAAGRIRIWKLKDSVSEKLPKLVLTYSIFNTTIVWRAPLADEGYVRGPMPPIPAYEDTPGLQIDRIVVEEDKKVSSAQTIEVQYENRILQNDQQPTSPTKFDPLKELRDSVDVKVSVMNGQSNVTEILTAKYQVKRISGDLSGVSSFLIYSKDFGFRLSIQNHATGSDSRKVNLNFDGAGLSVSNAIKGLALCEAFSTAGQGSVLSIDKQGSNIQWQLSDQDESSLSSIKWPAIMSNLESLQRAGRKMKVDLKLPLPSSKTDPNFLAGIANAIVNETPLRVTEIKDVELILPEAKYRDLLAQQEPATFYIGHLDYPFAGMPDFTKENIGPIALFGEINNPSVDLLGIKPVFDQGNVVFDIQIVSMIFVFEKFSKR